MIPVCRIMGVDVVQRYCFCLKRAGWVKWEKDKKDLLWKPKYN